MAFLRVSFYCTKDAGGPMVLRNNLVSKGNTFLAKYNMKFDVAPFGGGNPTEIDHTGMIPASGWQPPPGTSDQNGINVRKKLWTLLGGKTDGRIKVLICKIKGSGGEAPGTLGDPSGYGPFIMISDDTSHPDGLTLVHELGHCPGLPHPSITDDDDIMGVGLDRKKIYPAQLEAYQKASFYAGASST